MVCHKCSGQWNIALIHKRRMHVCSKCGYIDSRNGSCNDVPFGPNSPILTNDEFEPATLVEHLTAWWQGRRAMRPGKLISFIKWCWTNWSKNWDQYHQEQKDLMNLLKKGL